MAIEETFGNLFKSEIKTSGRKLVAQEKISLSSGSDTGIQAYVRVSPPFKVTFSAEDISSESFTAACTCPASKKSQLCKHVWATLICVEQKYPDFLSAKQSIEKPSLSSDEPSSAKNSYQETAKLRASEYRKAQYQKQKLRAKDLKRKRSGGGGEESIRLAAYPGPVAAALAYFSENGFPMPAGPSADVLGEAKRKLSRVFHPDKGGSHDESVELNKNCELLERFLGI